MTVVEELIQKLYDEGIETIEHPLLGSAKAACLLFNTFDEDVTRKYIIVDEKKIDNSKEEFYEIAHEEMHLEYPEETMYKLNEPYYIKKTKEMRCRKRMAKKYLPKENLFNLIYIEHLEVYEIADRLGITESLIRESLAYYSGLEWWIKKQSKITQNEL